jgi:N-acetylneuraminic acid mutarotase
MLVGGVSVRQAHKPWPLAGVIGVALVAVPAQARGLTFEDRVAAQQAIARVYYAHQIGATVPFEEAVPSELLEKQVLSYLQQSKALEVQWNTPITAEVLHAELQRMARGTRMPERLLELYDALSNDSLLIGECLARPVLVDRLARNFFAYDERLHVEARQAAESLRAQLVNGELDPLEEHPQRTVAERSPEEFESGAIVEEREGFRIDIVLERSSDTLRVARYLVNKRTWNDWWSDVARDFDGMAVDVVASREEPLPPPTRSVLAGCGPEDAWINGSLDDVPDGFPYRTVVWTGSRMVVWGGGTTGANTGSRYDPATDSWTPTSTSNAPAARTEHTAVWTGSRMVIWGGEGAGLALLNSGGLYDPETDSWSATSTLGAPTGRKWHSAVWTGSHMVVWGGGPFPFIDTGSRYDPETDSWSSTSTANAPSPRGLHSAVWTGSHMIVWGGQEGSFPFTPVGTGGRYDPETDSWTPTSSTDAPMPRVEHTAVWTGTWMVVWGGDVPDASATNTGSRYEPLTDSWSATSTILAPLSRRAHTAVWTGDRMVVWGGIRGDTELNTGGRYDPQANTWTPTSIVNAPSARQLHRAGWTGSLMVVWGGFTNTGGRYDPLTDTWTPTFTGSAAAPRARHTAVWTGNHMVVWGGESGSDPHPGTNSLNSGARYDPVTDSWTPTSTTGAPAARNRHTAIWSGDRMVVWGGAVSTPTWTHLNSGGRYDPLSDTWTATSPVNVPSARDYHTAVWTGSHMIVWGGREGPVDTHTGGRYDVTTDTWTPTSTVGAPSGREKHTAVWTGTRMVVWGGDYQDFPEGNFSVNSGGIYDPLVDSWTPTATDDAPQRRGDHTAVWTGSRMVVWGGVDYEGDFAYVIASGGSYDPVRDSWMPTSMVDVPSSRYDHTAVWSGSHMIVWGGGSGGGHYDPATNVWTPVSTVNAPEQRGLHSAVLTEDSMLVWGGRGNSSELGSGGNYVLALGVDNDGDGLSECLGDCTDDEPTVFDVPAEIEHLRWTSPDTLAWDSDAANSGTGTRYDLMYGDLADVSNFGTGAADTCMWNDLSQLQAFDVSPALAADEAWFFLVRGGNVCGNGRWETASDGSDRLTTVCP